MRACAIRKSIAPGVAALLLTLLGLRHSLGDTDPEAASTARFAAHAERVYREAAVASRQYPTNAQAAWEFARATFDWADYATNDTQRANVAEEGIAAGRSAVSNAPAKAAGYYYLGANLGQLARTRTLGALPLVSEMEQLFLKARDRDARFDYSGPDRNLGLLYYKAPGWPVSVGSRGKARKHLKRAAELSPDYPDNRLNLLEALLDWKEAKGVAVELKALEELMPRAATDFPGENWAAYVHDWRRRWPALRDKAIQLLDKSK